MLVTLAEMKTYLGITGNTYDSFLTEQIVLVSDAIELYCRRKLSSASYIQTYYLEDFEQRPKVIDTLFYPLTAVASITEDGILIDPDDYRIQMEFGIITKPRYFFENAEKLLIAYTAGYATIPPLIKSVVYSVVETKFNKKQAGVNLNFGNDVQRISIPGTISIDFDYTLTNNDRTNPFGNLLAPYLNILDYYRSERTILGQARLTYVA